MANRKSAIPFSSTPEQDQKLEEVLQELRGTQGAVMPALQKAQEIYDDRMKTWNRYYEALKELEEAGKIEMPVIPEDCVHNAHMFYIKARDLEERQKLIGYLKENGIISVFHYIPLHTAPAGMKYGEFRGEDKYTTTESERLLRLPMYYGLEAENVDYIAEKVKAFYSGK